MDFAKAIGGYPTLGAHKHGCICRTVTNCRLGSPFHERVQLVERQIAVTPDQWSSAIS